MKLTPLNAPQAPLPAGGYAQAFEVQGAGKLLFISGQIPQTAGGEVPDDFLGASRAGVAQRAGPPFWRRVSTPRPTVKPVSTRSASTRRR